MKGDFSRSTYRPANHYSSVRLQQGRVLLDAEWNEQADLTAHVDRTTGRDVVGRTGAPKPTDPAVQNFAVSLEPDGTDLRIAPGRIYVDGILCENDDPAGVRYTAQPDLPGAAVPDADGSYAVYLDVWERHLTGVDQYGPAFPPLVESALQGPDTATRTRVVWQVRLAPVETLDCAAFVPPTAPTGRLRASEVPVTGPVNDCSVPTGGGYRRLENQLYRVEVHAGSEAGAPVLKWSRDNASIVSAVTSVDPGALTIVVADAGRDDVLGLGAARWVELTDEERTLSGAAGALLEVASVVGTSVLVQNPDGLSLATGTNPTLRRWDGMLTPTVATPTELEDGVQVEIDEGTFAVGDYWLVPARTATGKVEWPREGTPEQSRFETRHGTEHHYCVLAVVGFAGGTFGAPADCRRLFPPLTAIAASDVGYDPSSCANLAGTTTVQQALDVLCQATPDEDEKGIHVEKIAFVDGTELRNDSLVQPEQLASGIVIACSEQLFQGSVQNKQGPENPVCTVTLDLPWPTTNLERETWGVPSFGVVGFVTITIAAQVNSDNNSIFWVPVDDQPSNARNWLATTVLKAVEGQTHGQLRRLLCRLTLKGNYIWGPGAEPELYLDGEAFGAPGDGHVDTRLPSGNGRRGGDFEMWFWLGRE
ncbi:DUF6519 domain-containing protein [Intrasporangium sp.]|uniref:DUF6519 domain-containing protein n=1 Tax=Intrasporangium sp. TaxID=1925024 RepID=UPI0032220344